jgi:putrescine transport system substrate-binding protein
MLSIFFAAVVAQASPFAPPPKPAPPIVRLLAPSGAFTPKIIREFERESRSDIAYDAYGDPQRIPSMMKDALYDVVILPGPTLARAIAAGQLRKIEKAQIPNARRVAPPIAAKLDSYDPHGGYSIAWGWSATGLLYDAGKAPQLLGAAPNSWTAALAPQIARKLSPCGVALPDSRDEAFIAAWRLLGVDPGVLREREVKAGADVIIRAREAVRLPVSRDPITAIAGGAVCLTFGGPAQAEIATRRSRQGRAGFDIRFVEPKEGGPMAIDALAEPRDAPHPKEALALIDFLLRPAVVAEATASAGRSSAETVGTENFRGLWPVGVYDPKLVPVIEKEWARTFGLDKQGAKAGQGAKGAKTGQASKTGAGSKPSPSRNTGQTPKRKHP